MTTRTAPATSKSPTAPARDHAGAHRNREQILRSSNRFWRTSDLPGPASTTHHLFSNLTDAGELHRIRKGLYWRGTKTPLGMSPPPDSALLQQLFPFPGVGPAGLSAANALRLSTQVPRRAEVAVPARAPADLGALKFVSRATRTGRKQARLTALEVAFLETLDGWEKLLEVSTADGWRHLRHLLAEETVRAENLARASSTEPGATRARLRELLLESGHSPAAQKVPAPDPRTRTSALQHTPAAS